MKATSILTIGCAAIALSVTSCTNFGSPNTYNMNEIGGVQETYYGTVTSVETVKIQANNANAGTGVGAVAGSHSAIQPYLRHDFRHLTRRRSC